MRTTQKHCPGTRAQRGQAFLLLVLLIVVGAGALIYSVASPNRELIERDRITSAALAEAKIALIGFALKVDLTVSGPRPGDLPCPDLNNDGEAESSCGSGTGSNQTQRLGRLPWKTLGLPDLRDGDGERLWYAVSNNFKNNFRTSCASPGLAGCLNSDSRGTITVRDRTGNVVNDGSNPDPFSPSGVIAVIFSPGRVLQRQGSVTPQDRSCIVGVNCDVNQKCTTSPASNTPQCNPLNYLDVLNGVEDNADFVDGSNTNGLISGEIRDASNNIIINDRLLAITYSDLVPLLERLVAKEVLNCLSSYAAANQNNGHYPFAAGLDPSSAPNYNDDKQVRFGRVPDTPFNTTAAKSTPSMSPTWQACRLSSGTWWRNWKELVFYSIATPYQPSTPNNAPTCGICLTVNPPEASADKRLVVMVAGKRLPGQFRSTNAEKGNPANYLEDDNNPNALLPATTDVYTKLPTSTLFNDYMLFR